MSGQDSEKPPDSKLPQWLHLEKSDHLDKPIEVEISGQIPDWVSGSLYRNGPGLYKVGNTTWNHVFDGFATIQRWTFRKGKVTFRSSVLNTGDVKLSEKRGRIIAQGFASRFPDPCESIFSKFFNWFVPSPPGKAENTNINIVEFGDRLLALTESELINEVNPDTLKIESKKSMFYTLGVQMGTAHPHTLKDGTMIYYGTSIIYKMAYNFFSFPPKSDPSKPLFSGAKVLATVPSRWKMNISYTHSFGMTENYFVHLEQPLTVSLPDIVFMNPLNKELADSIVTHDGEPMDILLINRTTGRPIPITYRAASGAVFHFINCYEESGHVIADVILWWNGAGLIKNLYIESLRNNLGSKNCGMDPIHFARFVLPLDIYDAEAGKNLVTLPYTTATAFLEKGNRQIVHITPETIGENLVVETPRINYDFNGVKYRYFYASTLFLSDQHKLAKFDLEEKRVMTFDVGKHHMAGEPVFLPRPGATREDDGLILSSVVACNSSVQSYLVILDGTSFKEVARASLPKEVKMSFTTHGNFTDKFL